MNFYTKKNGLCNQVNDTASLFTQHTPVEENAMNLSQKRSEHNSNINIISSERNHQSKLIKENQNLVLDQNTTRKNYNISSAQKIHSIYPDGVTLINLNNNREPGILRSVPQCHPHIMNHHPRKNVCMQFYTNPRIDLHIPIDEGIDKLHFSPLHFYHHYNILYPQTFQNLAAINNLKIDFTLDRNQLSEQIKEEPIKEDVYINFQDICMLLDVLMTRIKWNFKHMLDSINTHTKISINDYWRDEGHLKFKLCLTDVINIIEEIKKLNSVLFMQYQSPKELQVDELTQELEAFIKRSRKMFVTEMQETLRNEYVQYCEDFLNNQLKILFLEHKKKYRAIFERVLTENNVAKVESTKENATKMVESATQTLIADVLNTKCTETNVIRKVTNKLKQIINTDGANNEKRMTEGATQTSKAVNGVKTNCDNVALKTIKNQNELNKSNVISSPQNIKGAVGVLNNYITITQCPKSPSSTQIPNSYNLIQEAKVAKKRMTDKHEVSDTVIITPKYPIKADLPDGFRIKNSSSTSSEGQYFVKDHASYYCEITKMKKNVPIPDCTSKIKKRKFSREENLFSKHKRTGNGENIIREETCRNKFNNTKPDENDLDVVNFKLKESQRMSEIQVNLTDEERTTISKKKHFQIATKQDFTKLKHVTNNNAEQNKNNIMTHQVKVRAEEFVKSRQDELEITPTIKINTGGNVDNKTSKNSKTDSIDGKVITRIHFSKANNEELKQSHYNVSASISNMNKKLNQAGVLKNITKEKPVIKKSDNFDKNEISTRVQTSNSPSQQKNVQRSLVRTSIINFINKNSLREKCTKSKVKVNKQFEETERTLHSSDQESDKVITSRQISSKDCILKHDNPVKNSCNKQTNTSSTKKSQFIGTDLDNNNLKNFDGNKSKNQAGMGFVQQIQGLEVKHHLTPEEYVDEVMAVDKMYIPIVFKRFYTYVTKQQILQQVNPISFKLFLELFNNGGLQNFYRKYIDYQKKHEVV